MSSLIDKVKGKVAPIKEGGKITSKQGLKENNFKEPDLWLNNLTGKNLLVGVPGAFTGPCSEQVPVFNQHADAFANKGIKNIYVVSVNDQFVTAAWKEKLGANHALLRFAADDSGSFTRELGLTTDATIPLLGSERATRYVAFLEDTTVKKLWVEDDATQVTVTKAEAVLQGI